MTELFTQKQVSEKMGFSTQTVRRLREQGKLKYYKVGHAVRISQEHIDEFLRDSERCHLNDQTQNTGTTGTPIHKARNTSIPLEQLISKKQKQLGKPPERNPTRTNTQTASGTIRSIN